MRILTHYLLRAHVGPFIFALSTLTGLLFLNAVAQRLDNLAGKGLELSVIWEFLVLSLPHTVALTLPMAVLVAVLYAFSELAANNEITAIKAGGVRPQRMMVPLLLAGTAMGSVMLYFNDQVLPEANHRLRQLTIDINRKTPTFILREQVVNTIRAGVQGTDIYYLVAAEIDNEDNRMRDVVIYDASDARGRKTIYADRADMAFNAARTDLYLTLRDGVTFETKEDRPGDFQQTAFDVQILPLRGVGNELERRAGDDRGDREMNLAMLDSAADERSMKLDSIRGETRDQARIAVLRALGRDSLVVAGRRGPGVRVTIPTTTGGQPTLDSDELTMETVRRMRTHWALASSYESRANRYRVELHKKLTLAVACIVFVLVGAPLAIRFPRGGLGLVIAASSAIFAIYWAGLIGGESLADRGVAPPAFTMWIPNLVFTGIGLWLFATMGRESATSRGGGWEDLLWTVRKTVMRPFRGRGPSTGSALHEGGAP